MENDFHMSVGNFINSIETKPLNRITKIRVEVTNGDSCQSIIIEMAEPLDLPLSALKPVNN